jgi:hypothetical protein
LELNEIVINSEYSRTYAVWAEITGRVLTKPVPVLSQHVYGPGMPAYVVETPKTPGNYFLSFLDERGHEIASRLYEVRPDLLTQRKALAEATLMVNSAELSADSTLATPIRMILENRSSYYLQANLDRPVNGGTARFQPGLLPTTPGSLGLQVQINRTDTGHLHPQIWPILCPDLPPHGRVELIFPGKADYELGYSTRMVQPCFTGMAPQISDEQKADVRLMIKGIDY